MCNCQRTNIDLSRVCVYLQCPVSRVCALFNYCQKTCKIAKQKTWNVAKNFGFRKTNLKCCQQTWNLANKLEILPTNLNCCQQTWNVAKKLEILQNKLEMLPKNLKFCQKLEILSKNLCILLIFFIILQ